MRRGRGISIADRRDANRRVHYANRSMSPRTRAAAAFDRARALIRRMPSALQDPTYDELTDLINHLADTVSDRDTVRDGHHRVSQTGPNAQDRASARDHATPGQSRQVTGGRWS